MKGKPFFERLHPYIGGFVKRIYEHKLFLIIMLAIIIPQTIYMSAKFSPLLLNDSYDYFRKAYRMKYNDDYRSGRPLLYSLIISSFVGFMISSWRDFKSSSVAEYLSFSPP